MAEKKNDILIRSYLVFTGFLLLGICILGKVAYLQVSEGEMWRSKADSLTLDYKSIEPMRGSIYTADGRLLATSIPRYDVHLDMKSPGMKAASFNDEVDSLAYCLANLFRDKSKEEYRRMLREARGEGDRFFLLKRNISYKQQKALKSFPIFRQGKNKGGLILDQTSRRERPFNILAQRTVGFSLPNKSVQPVGIEGAFDKDLSGTQGKRLMRRIAGGVWKPVNTENEIEPNDGYDIVTTIDLNLQDVAENALMNQLSAHNAEMGCAVLMEVSTGHIKAIANLRRNDAGEYSEDYNFVLGYRSEPGSTFKLASVMAALEDGLIDLDDTVDTYGGKQRLAGGYVLSDSHNGGYGRVSVKKAFAVSTNVGIYQIIKRSYEKNPQAFIDRLRSMHIADSIPLQIKGGLKPRMKNTYSEDWSKNSLAYMSIGYESLFTPLQLLTFYNAVANNGKMVKPLFVKEIRNMGEVVRTFPTEVIADSICSSKTIAKARELLEEVVRSGTASHIKHAQYSIAGKTGTAQIAQGSSGYGAQKKYQASFCGYFPADKPRYSCAVVVYSPGNNVYYAASVACPVFKDIADKVYALDVEMHKELTAPPDSVVLAGPVLKAGRSVTANKTFRQLGMATKVPAYGWVRNDLKEYSPQAGKVPDVTGMGLRDAMYLLERQGFQVKPSGRGAVLRQSIKPGSTAEKGSLITIELG